ncbi:MAG: methylated-DNA--[protein]-cysteine S-methyltransferase [Deltaproteobacteria bacterium]|jgi:O-6-methylguanine DNA methyltransferase|nr:methylated-DNA--[protein]-cysteine S-methyltransferase [Deltaproteobacteria bacterium]
MTASGSVLFPTTFGHCGIGWSKEGVAALVLPDTTEKRTARTVAEQSAGPVDAPPVWVAEIIARVQQHLRGERQRFDDLPVDLDLCSPFALRVYRELRKVGPGQTVTYGQLAARVGQPGAARAVGRAMATNRVPLIVPCHRVLAAAGPGAFSACGGVGTKLRLLTVEGADLDPVRRWAEGELARRDEALASIIRRVGRCRMYEQRDSEPFSALAAAIIHQQVSMSAGRTIFGRLVEACGGQLDAASLLSLGGDKLQACGISRQKRSYLEDLASRVKQGSLQLGSLRLLDDRLVIEALTAVKGIGLWTAQMFLMFRLGRLDVLPTDDLGLRQGASRVYGWRKVTPQRLERQARLWAPYRSIATWYLWRANEAGGLCSLCAPAP